MPPSLPSPAPRSDKRDRNTYRHFSPPGERYLDAYTIHNAEEDEEIVPCAVMRVVWRGCRSVGKTLDQLFEDLFYDKTEEEKAILKEKVRDGGDPCQGGPAD